MLTLLGLLGPLASPEPGALPGLEAYLLGDPRLMAAATAAGSLGVGGGGSSPTTKGGHTSGSSSSPVRWPVDLPDAVAKDPTMESM